jgi:ectonucleotide pyrophosphatase/phosphodiesterase family protein 5
MIYHSTFSLDLGTIYYLITFASYFHSVCEAASVTGPNKLNVPRVLLVSFDGFRWDYLSRSETKNHTLNFHRIMKDGIYAKRGIKNAFITKTFPNHYTIVTGLYEESHGIVANVMYDPVFNETFNIYNVKQERSPKWFDNGGEPIWVTNQLQDDCNCRKTGVVFWPGDSASVKGVLPYRYLLYDKTMKNKTRVDTMVKWFTDKYPVNLGLLYFEEPDSYGHEFGPDSPQMNEMIIGLDGVVGYLLDELKAKGILDSTDIIITSDHGMASTPNTTVINLDDHISVNDYRIFASNPIGNILPNPGKIIWKKILIMSQMQSILFVINCDRNDHK